MSHDLFDHIENTLQNAIERGTTDKESLNNILQDFGFTLTSFNYEKAHHLATATISKKIYLTIPEE